MFLSVQFGQTLQRPRYSYAVQGVAASILCRKEHRLSGQNMANVDKT